MNKKEKQPKNIKYYCSVEATLHILSGKWKVIILYHLTDQVLRYNQLRKLIPNISQKVLTEQLRELEEDGLIYRLDYDEIPRKVEYGLTSYGFSIKPILSAMCKWGREHIQKNNWQLSLIDIES